MSDRDILQLDLPIIQYHAKLKGVVWDRYEFYEISDNEVEIVYYLNNVEIDSVKIIDCKETFWDKLKHKTQKFIGYASFD
jgi:hypothetical protein